VEGGRGEGRGGGIVAEQDALQRTPRLTGDFKQLAPDQAVVQGEFFQRAEAGEGEWSADERRELCEGGGEGGVGAVAKA
jgi:hypothetical protein